MGGGIRTRRARDGVGVTANSPPRHVESRPPARAGAMARSLHVPGRGAREL